ncbi:hypothetical protein FWJ25_14015 [Marinobacter salinexigens]|uniref:C4-dicarboxylate ABC transporter substrate-binding protein n=1 Tax=Marinobacter salinexigens TaxID=2919747 RepID=A0A5B0VDS3_9GAMM|nr:C4-dicarboxylate TRAP transporter substrate-binding protein [Marinobacter salinexigens]KAA1172305.1 hypothetical protein FWJ25_14015 [Marinobacter salinexigens]
MLKKRLGLFSSIGVSVVLVAGSITATPALARDLSYGSYLPPHHPTSTGMKVFFDEVESGTEGDIKFNFFPSGAAASGKELLSAVRDGMIDGGFLVTVYYPTSLPANTTISDLSFWDQNSLVATAASIDTVLTGCPQCIQEFEDNDVRFLASYGTPPYQAMCKADFANGFDPKGLRMRVAGEEIGRWVTQIGGIPVNIPNSESYEAMERSQLDCVIGATSWLKSLSLNEVANSVVELPMGSFVGGSLLNIRNSVWEELSDAEQQAVVSAVPLGVAKTIFEYQKEEQEVRGSAAEKGIGFIEVSDQMKQVRADFMQAQVERAAATAAGRGVENADRIVASFIANLEKWEKLLADPDITEEEYAALLKSEIYDKAF